MENRNKQVTRRRSSDYAFTTTNPNDSRIADLKLHARIMGMENSIIELKNPDVAKRAFKSRYRVVVRGRLGKDNPNAHLYRAGGPLKRLTSQDIRHEHAQRFDVYLREVRIYR